MKRQFISELSLTNYRNFEEFNIHLESPRIVIVGDNGSGKTNILESISLLSGGKGFRGTKFEDICKSGSSAFKTAYKFDGIVGTSRISTSFDANLQKKTLEFNDDKISNSELAKICTIIWLTPQLEWVFSGSASDRRKFFDRIIYTIDKTHASRVNKYEYYLRERIKILQLPRTDLHWLDIIEEKLSEVSLELIAKRHDVARLLQNAINELDTPFPKATITITPDYSDKDKDWIISQFRSSRKLDMDTGRSSFAPHRVDFVVFHKTKNIEANFCSTGEQKALLISITMAHTLMLKNIASYPILLLDEIFVHLDDTRRGFLSNFLSEYKSQIWITSTEDKVTEYFAGTQSIRL